MLTASYKCEHCDKENCDVLYFDKIRKQWNCIKCTRYLKQGEGEIYGVKERRMRPRAS